MNTITVMELLHPNCNALNTRDFYPVLGEIRIVGPVIHADIFIRYARKL